MGANSLDGLARLMFRGARHNGEPMCRAAELVTLEVLRHERSS